MKFLIKKNIEKLSKNDMLLKEQSKENLLIILKEMKMIV